VRFRNYDEETISCDSYTTVPKSRTTRSYLRVGLFVFFFGYRPTRRLEGLSIFAIVYFDVVQGMLVRWAGVGWGSLAFAHQHDGTLEMGWGGVGWG
jgi:hypothetical protein